MHWYYAKGRERVGPFNQDAFDKLVLDGIITEKTLVWNQTFENWKPYGSCGYRVEMPAGEIVIKPDKDEFGDMFGLPDEATAITDRPTGFQNLSDRLKEKTEDAPDDLSAFPITFSGTAGEYFRIWIVNLFLTIITLGIYAAWAKVRSKQYFYANTLIDGESFDYLGKPLSILKGNLLIAGAFILFQIISTVSPGVSIIMLLAFVGVIPFLIYKSFAFNARNTAYRNIRFQFRGTVKESYIVFLLLPILMPFTMWILYPYWYFRLKKYILQNYCFGASENRFSGKPSFFYETILLAMGLMMLISMVVFILIGIMAAMAAAAGGAFSSPQPEMKMFGAILVPLVVLAYLVLILISSAVKTFIYVKLSNYCFEATDVGNLRFEGNYRTKSLLWIKITNIFGILFSVGLLAPWAMIRTYRYRTENIVVLSDGKIDEFKAADGDDVSAIGDSAADFFDMEIGL